MIVKAWIDYVEKTVMVVNEVDWNDIPGYKLIVECFIKEMEIRALHHLPDALR